MTRTLALPAAVCAVLAFVAPGAGASEPPAGPGFRSVAVRPATGASASAGVGFTWLDPAETGVLFTNVLAGDAYWTNAVAHNGSGLALGDVDGDGWTDIYLCNLEGPNRLYRNLGDWRFQPLDPGAAVCAGQYSTGATFADVDGNGSLDLLVNGIGVGTRLFLNDGTGRFSEGTDSGLSRTASATSLALADMDGDGDLDLYCTHYIDVMHLADPTTRFALARRGDQWVVSKVNDESTQLPKWRDRFEVLADRSVRELPEYHGFYRNDGPGRFTPILFEPGVFRDPSGQPIRPFRDWGLSVMFRDLNGDRAPDLYVCNDNASPDRVWMNTGQGTFTALPPDRQRHTSRSSMGLDIADVNRDGQDDVFVLDMLAREHAKRMTQLMRDRPNPEECERAESQPRYNRNMLFLGRPDGSFTETALLAGVATTGWSWCPMFVDVDLDGYEDLLVTTGFGMDVMDQDSHDRIRQSRMTHAQRKRIRQFHPAWPTQCLAFRNRGDGTFEPMDHWGFDRAGIANGAALGDLDQDGDLDLVVNHLNAVAGLYRNNATGGRVAVRLRGRSPNTQGIGARIRLIGASLTQSQEMICGGRYMSGDQALRVFAAEAGAGQPLRLDVRWRSGAQSVVPEVQAGRLYEIHEPEPGERPAPASPSVPDHCFEEASAQLGHVHVEAPFDDAQRQPMLPRRLSRMGPGVGWYDLNGDGWEDLLVGAGRGGGLAVYLNDAGRGFRRVEGAGAAAGDHGTVLGLTDGAGHRQVLAATSNYELAPPADSRVTVFSGTNLATGTVRSAGVAGLGAMAAADVDGDGDLDLFLGGRCRPGRYPEPVSSAIWRQADGTWVADGPASAPFQEVGLVSGATFVDLNGDSTPDLVLAMEWGPIRVFENHGGRFEDRTDRWGLAATTGWWTSVVAGDFDGDGAPDLACGNWGRNSIYELCQPSPIRLAYGDWNGDGVLEMVEGWQHQGQWLPVRDRTWLARGLPDLVERFPTHEAFARATLGDVLPPGHAATPTCEARVLASTVFLNRGGRFEAVPLPLEAQWAPVFGIAAGDLDADGVEDLFLGQNFLGWTSDLTREDGGRGLWLRGTGRGRFEPVAGAVSGIQILGEQRGVALADFNHDGRVDLAVGQNAAATKLYLNRGGRRGLRVSLRGPAGNPEGVGAQLRVLYAGQRRGPCRIVQAGSGYWSQDAATQVLGVPDEPIGLSVRWPDGKEQTVSLNRQDWDVRVERAP